MGEWADLVGSLAHVYSSNRLFRLTTFTYDAHTQAKA